MSTAPWTPDVLSQLTRSTEHTYSVSVLVDGQVIPLTVIDGTLSYDEGWTPHVQASLTVAIPEDQATLDLLDPRLLPRVRITAGYVFDDRRIESHQIANLILRDRTVSRPQGTMQLDAASDECLLDDAGVVGPTSIDYPGVQVWSLTEALRVMMERATGVSPSIVVSLEDQVEIEMAWLDTWQSLVSDWVDQAAGWFYHDGMSSWFLRRRPDVVASTDHVLSVGPGGNITGSQAVLTREGDQWANDVFVHYTWRAGGFDYMRYGHAWISGGPWRAYDVDPIGFDQIGEPRLGIKRLVYQREGQISQLRANAAARAILARRASGGRRLSIDAVAAYWLRPGATITAQLPTGDQERQLVSSVSFRIPAGDMTVHTRLPDVAPITTGE